MISKKKIIFILPYLNVNTTSAERFKSFIRAAELNESLDVEVIEIDYGIERSYFSGLSTSEVDTFYPKNYHKYLPKFNIIQKTGFRALNSGNVKLWRLLQLLHLILYRIDIFYPKYINKNFLHNYKKEGYVFSSGSHYSIFTTSQKLAKDLNYKLLLDYRDPWTYGYNPIDGFSFVHYLKVLLGRSKEKKLLNDASQILTVSKSLKDFFPNDVIHKINIVPNGSNFSHSEVSKKTDNSCFKIVYAGTVYNEQLEDETFFRAFSSFIVNKDTEKIKLEFIGSDGNKILKDIIKKYKLTNVFISKRVNKKILLKHLNQASLFLHFKLKSNKVISSKMAEYLNFGRPILLPISDEGDLKESILANNAGYVCYNESEIINVLENLYTRFLNKENLYINPTEALIEKISRKAIAEDFFNSL